MATDTQRTRAPRPRSGKILSNVVIVVGILVMASFLPPDTSLQVVAERGSLRACVPTSYPPLVYPAGSDRRGIDLELLREIGERLEVSVRTVENPAIGRDFNPRNWRVTRAQCEVIAGGVVGSSTTRSFLETTDPYLETGWSVVFPGDQRPLEGTVVGFHAGTSGLDRISLSRYLQSSGATVRIVPSQAALISGLESGELDAAVTESLSARQIADDIGGSASWVPEQPRYPIVLGLWKADLTLKRALEAALDDIEADGTLEKILARYEIAEIEPCDLCAPESEGQL